MNRSDEVKGKEPPRGGSRRSTSIRYSPEEKLKAVRLVLEDGFSRNLVCQEIGVCRSSLVAWIGKYRAEGEAALRSDLECRPAIHDPPRSGCCVPKDFTSASIRGILNA